MDVGCNQVNNWKPVTRLQVLVSCRREGMNGEAHLHDMWLRTASVRRVSTSVQCAMRIG